jgi:hypothetical protein
MRLNRGTQISKLIFGTRFTELPLSTIFWGATFRVVAVHPQNSRALATAGQTHIPRSS